MGSNGGQLWSTGYDAPTARSSSAVGLFGVHHIVEFGECCLQLEGAIERPGYNPCSENQRGAEVWNVTGGMYKTFDGLSADFIRNNLVS